MPESRLCVPCLESVGDVPLIRRFDEFVGEDKFELFYTSDEDGRFSKPRYYGNLSLDAVNAALGDDQLLTRGGNQIVAAAYGLPTAFEEDNAKDADHILLTSDAQRKSAAASKDKSKKMEVWGIYKGGPSKCVKHVEAQGI